MHSHLPRYVRQHFMAIFEFHPKHCIGQGLKNPTFNLYCFLFSHTFSILSDDLNSIIPLT